jgi:hypothetical protein
MGVLRSDIVTHSSLATAGASVLFDGGDGNAGTTGLKTADSGNKYEIQGDTSELTIECWIYCTNITNTFDTIWATNNYGISGNSANFYQHYDGIYFTISGLTSDLDIRGLFEVNRWYHVATTRQWSVSKSTHQWRIYVDGEIVGYAETGSSITEGVLNIGCNNYAGAFPAFEFAGYISNFRMCKRVLYKEKFTPSKFKLKDVPGTVLLCCQDASDDTAVTVGDTLTAGGSPTPGGFGPDLKEDITDIGPVFGDGAVFDTLSYMVPPGGTTTQRGRDRGVASQGYSPGDGASGAMTFFNISSGGITQRFGSLVTTSYTHTGGSSSTRGVIAGGYLAAASPVYDVNTIEYVTIATTGNALNFGDRTVIGRTPTAVSSETRVCMAGGGSTYTNIIDFITTSTTGDATNFGDLGNARTGFSNSMQSTTRGIFAGGYQAPSPNPAVNTLEYITMASAGDATNFGDMTSAGTNSYGGSMSSNTRGVTALGNAPGATNIINYVTIATTGDAVDFGDMTTTRKYSASCSSHTRGVIIGGETPTYVNTIEYITIATTGNSIDFGDFGSGLSAASRNAAFSDCHGGLS